MNIKLNHHQDQHIQLLKLKIKCMYLEDNLLQKVIIHKILMIYG